MKSIKFSLRFRSLKEHRVSVLSLRMRAVVGNEAKNDQSASVINIDGFWQGNILAVAAFVTHKICLVLDKFLQMHRVNPKYIRIAVIVLVSLIVVLTIGGYIVYTKREALLQKAITKAQLKAKRDYNLDLKIGSAHFTGLSTVAFTDISIVPLQRDSLLSIKKFEVSVKLLPLIYGNIKLADVVLQDGHLNLTDINHVKNFDFLFKKRKRILPRLPKLIFPNYRII